MPDQRQEKISFVKVKCNSITTNTTDIERQRRHERKETRILILGFAEQNADPESHKRLREVDHLFADVTDR